MDGRVLGFALLAGVSVVTSSIFLRLTFSGIHPALGVASGLRVTSSFVIGGTSTALVLLVGFARACNPFQGGRHPCAPRPDSASC